MLIREATADDWPRIWPFWHRIVAAGETYAWDPGTSEEEARVLWMNPAKRVYVVEDDSGAVVETNPAVTLWTSLGFTVLGTVPDAFDHPRHGRVGLHIMYRAL